MKLLTQRNISGLMMAVLLVLLTTFAFKAQAARCSDDDKTTAATKRRTAVIRGRASWYGREHQGQRTSSGERFDRNKYTCAHKTLPFGTKLRVSNPATGKAVVVRVTDRGPFRHQRILDLAEVAARPLGIVQAGTVAVVAEVVAEDTPVGPADVPDDLSALTNNTAEAGTLVVAGETEADDLAVRPEPTPTFVVQAGTFGDARNAQAVQDRILALDSKLLVSIVASTQNGKPLNRVLIGGLPDRLTADKVRQQLHRIGIAGLVRQGENLQ